MAISKLEDLNVYRLSEDLAMNIFLDSKSFPIEEKYSLTDQIRRSSRSVAANIAEGWGKRIYQGLLARHLTDANGSLEETRCWIRFAHKCEYIDEKRFQKLSADISEIGAKLFKLKSNWK